jgi:hypothetical protein
MKTLTFIIPIKNETERLDSILTSIRNNYPTERIVLFANDVSEQNIPTMVQYSEQFNTEYVFTDKIYSYETPAKLFRDIFDIFMQKPTDFLIRIDTDAFVHKPISNLEGYEDCVFGCVHERDENTKEPIDSIDKNKIFSASENQHSLSKVMPTYVNGVIGFSAPLVQYFILKQTFAQKNDVLLIEKYKQSRNITEEQLNTYPLWLDHILAIGCKEAGIKFKDHPEIYSLAYSRHVNLFMGNKFLNFQPCVDEINNKEKYAFVHPVDRY